MCDVVLTIDSDQYDVFIITSDGDEDNACKLAHVLVKFCKLFFDYDLTVHPELELGENKLDHLRSGLARSTYRFIFIDDGFQECNLVKFGTDAALMEMINRRDQSIVPVKAHSGILLPPLLRMFRPLDIHKLLRGKHLDEVDVGSLTETDIDKLLLDRIVKMVKKLSSGMSGRPSAAEQSPSMSFQHTEVIRRHYADLVSRLDPDNGLVSELYSAGVINARQMENVRVEKTYYDRNECLLKLLQRSSEKDFVKFVEILQKVGQSHVAEMLCCDSSRDI